MKENSIIKNVLFAFLLQSANALYPLITAPYISYIIGSNGLGKVNFSTSVVGWFTIVATFGTTTYGVKEVAKLRDEHDKLSLFFSEILIVKVLATIVSIALYLPCIIYVDRFSQEYLLFLVQGSVLVLNIFSLDWFFQGVEDYKYIATRSILFKVISLAALFILVKAKEDYIVYAGISVFALSFSNILNYIYSRNYVRFSWKKINIRRHTKSLLVFFLSSVVVSVYALMDQVMLGFIKGNYDVALYVRAKLLLGSGMIMSSTISNVIMPRLNNYFIKDKNTYTDLLRISVDIIVMISIPIMVGIVVLAKTTMYMFGGEEFVAATNALIIIAPLAIIVPIGLWNYHQRMLPHGHERIGLYGQIAMASVSVVSNIILIPRIGFIGAAISYLLAEGTGTVIGFSYMRNKDNFRVFTVSQLKYMLSAVGMAVCVVFIQSRLLTSWSSLFYCVIIGMITYFLLLFIMKDKILFLIFSIIKQKFLGR